MAFDESQIDESFDLMQTFKNESADAVNARFKAAAEARQQSRSK